MTWSLVNTFTNDAGYTGTGTFTDYQVTVSGVSVGDLLIVQFQFGFSDVSATATCSDNAGVANTYTPEKALYDSGNAQGVMRFSAPVGDVTGLTKVTVSWPTVGLKFVSCAVEQWHNSGGSFSGTVISGTPAGQDQAGAGTGTDAVTSTNTTPSVNGCLIHSTLCYPGSAPATITHGTGFTPQLNDFVAVQMGSEYLVQTTAAGISGTWTQGTSLASLTLVTAYAPPGGGGPTIVSTTDTATLAEGTPVGIAVSGPTDTMSLAEKGSVAGTIGGLTDSLSLSETATVGPQANDVLSLDDAAFTIVATDVTSLNDFTLSEGPIVIGVGGPSDALSLAEGTTRIVATISISDVLTLDDSNVTVTSGGVTSLTETDTLTLGEFLSLLDHAGMGDAATLVESVAIQVQAALQDSASLTERASVAGTMALSDSLSLAESLSIAIVGGFTGYAKGTLVIVARLAGTVSVADRLKGSTAGAPRLRGTQTTQPVGPP